MTTRISELAVRGARSGRQSGRQAATQPAGRSGRSGPSGRAVSEPGSELAGGLDGGLLDGGLIEDKLRIPRPEVAVLPRRRVAELLGQAVAHRVTLMTGPPGAGKTVAAAEWVATLSDGFRPAWVSLDQDDRDPARFWGYVAAALSGATGRATEPVMAESVGPAVATSAGLAERGLLAPAGIAAADELQRISTVLRARPEPVLLVLDNIQALAESETLSGLNKLIQHEPPGLRLLLIGRYAPGLALARFRLAGELADIGAADLACTSEETTAYFAMLGRTLSGAERAQVLEQTEGWLAGLRLTALAAESPAPGTDGTLIGDYLQDEVLSQLPDRARSFLLRTCVTPTVSAELARDLTGEPGSARLLEQLSRESGLIQPVTPGSPAVAAEYRYHPMLRAVLAADLHRELPDEVTALHGRVARWHAGRGQVLEAVQAAEAVGDWEFGLQLLRDAGPAVMLSAAAPGLEAALASLPAGQLDGDLTVAIARAAARLWQADPDGAVPYLEETESGLGSLAGRDLGRAQMWVAALRMLHHAALGAARPDGLRRDRRVAARGAASQRGVPEHQALGVLWLALGFAALGQLDTRRARSALVHAGSQLAAGGLFALRERGRSWEAVACALDGDLAAATRLADGVADGLRREDDDLAPVLALAGAAVSLARDEAESAAALLDQAELSAVAPRLAGEPSIAIIGGLLRARLAVADGNLAGARGLVRWLADTAAGQGRVGYPPDDLGSQPGTADFGPDPVSVVARRSGTAPAGRSGTAAAIEVMDAEISLAAGERERARATLATLTAPGQDGLATLLPAAPMSAGGVSAGGVSAGEETADDEAGEHEADGAEVEGAEVDGAEAGSDSALLSRPEAVVCQARLLIADSDEKQALKLLEPLLADGTGAWPVSDRIAALLAAVVAHRRLGQSGEATESLSASLALAEPDDACGPFLAAGLPIRSALTALISPASRFAGFAGRIVDRFDRRLAHPVSAQSAGGQLTVLLTDSELAVLRFLPSHMTNQEIAEALFLSINTIKTHLSSVYRKLGVANRRQAIAQGRRLELLLAC